MSLEGVGGGGEGAKGPASMNELELAVFGAIEKAPVPGWVLLSRLL